MSKPLPTTARVVIIGGGVIGCSVAYHLAKLGWQDVVLLERKKLTCGTTWHAAGLLTTLRSTENQTRLARYTQQLYRELEAETGQATGFNQCGSIQLATTLERVEEMRRSSAMAKLFGIESEEITAARIQELWPLAEVSDIEAGFYFPNDGRVNPTDVTQALAKGARMRGVKIFEDTKVTAVRTHRGRAVGVACAEGEIACEYVVNCAGMWARELGRSVGVDVPLQAAEHYYLVTAAMAGMHPKLPILRDPGNCAYYREEAGKLMLGLFEPVARPWGQGGIPEGFCFDEIQPDWGRMEPYLEQAMKRVPGMLDAGIQLFFCGPESFTPDHNYLLGEAPNLQHFFVAAGFNSLGILSGGGAGMVMAEWIVNGAPPLDIWDANLARLQPFHNNHKFLQDRTVESLGVGYQYHWPYRQWETARDVKRLVLHDRLAAAGACFGESAGWERPNWYARPGQTAEYQYSYGRQNWFENSADEHHAVRNAVGLFEQSSFAKLLVQGRDAETLLNRLSTADLAVPVGKAVYTQWLNPRGGIEADLIITRMDETAFLVVTPAFTQTHVQAWVNRHIQAHEFCVVTDLTSSYSMLNIQGPRARELLARVTDADLGNTHFPYATMREIAIGYQTVKALRLSYSGELGWELYIPTEFTAQVFDRITTAGSDYGLRLCGYHALNSLRLEKGYREWGHDIGADDTPVEAGLCFTCDWRKPAGFIGRDAVLARIGAGHPQRSLVQLVLNDSEPLLYHHEPVYRDGERVGYTTSAAYGHTLGASVALAYVAAAQGVTPEFIASGKFEVEIGKERFAATASLSPRYDANAERPRA